MKKTRKKVLGIIGLTLVVAMTVLAILLPGSEASALDTNPVTDEVQVRVVGSVPMVSLIYPEDGSVFVDPLQHFQFKYENVETTTTEIYYTDTEGNQHIYTLDTVDPDYNPGTSEEYPLDLSDERYGYGDYIIVTSGVGFGGVTAEDSVSFSFYPVYGVLSDDSEEGVYYLSLRYFNGSEELANIIVNVYDADGNLVEALSPIEVSVPDGDKELKLPFADNDLPSGQYSIEIIGVDADGEPLGNPYIISLDYTKKDDGGDEPGSVVPAPNTGRFSGVGNISNSDVILTSLVIFTAAVVVSIVVVAYKKNDCSNKK